ncbi:CATRA conflict system CASPASE/TPR repeat-associated protein [Streptomyces sp. NPDC008317]|uniref:CATRA conflict system CASPASE/TPR repeat-associated protein n=1 Tax=Streptomyces sp. NPDC008317 TaxID=3364827 RepID=UPI0036E07AE1
MTEQEVVVHVFVPLDAPRADVWPTAVRVMWQRFRALQRANQPVWATAPTEIPEVLPDAALHGSVTVAAVQSPGGLDQAIVRRHGAVLNLSLLLGAREDRAWPELEQRAADVLGPLDASCLGAVVLLVGKQPGGAVGGLDLLEPEREDDDRYLRRLLLLGHPEQDAFLGAWAWSADSSAEMPPFVSYLMHMAAVRHQLRVHKRLSAIDGGDTGLRALVRLPYGGGIGELPLGDPARALRALRHTVDVTWTNARLALRRSREAHGGDVTDTDVLDDDREVVDWFVQLLEDGITRVETTDSLPVTATAERQGARQPPPDNDESEPSAELAPVAATAPTRPDGCPVRVLAVTDEWFPAHGGLTAFNRGLCLALTAAGAEVHVLVENFTAKEQADAEEHGVRLLAAARPGRTGRQSLMRRAELPEGVVPDLVIGHGRVSGPAAQAQAEDHFRGARRLHFLHVEPDQAEWSKEDEGDDVGARAEALTELEFDLCRGAARIMPVGPRLEELLERERGLPGYRDLPPIQRIDPGFDGEADPVDGPRSGRTQILFMGRLKDAQLKGLDIACRALEKAVPPRSGPGHWELLVRGAPEDTSRSLSEYAKDLIGHPAIDVKVRTYTEDQEKIRRDVRRASLVLMPSRAEAFGLVALEAIVAGVPVLVSGRSGLGMLLREILPAEAEQVVVDVDGYEKRLAADAAAWERAINSVMFDRPSAFARAARLRKAMAERVTWGTAAAHVLRCAEVDGRPQES